LCILIELPAGFCWRVAMATMGFASEDSHIVEAHLVAKNTFFHLKPQQSTVLRRSKSDSFIQYGFETESEDNSTSAGSCTSSICGDPLELDPSSDHEEHSALSATSDSVEEASHHSNNAMHQQAMHAPQQQFYYCYMAAPGSPAWMPQGTQSNMLAAQQGAGSCSSEALRLEADALELRAAAAQLKAAAMTLEAVAQGSTPPQCANTSATWGYCPSQMQASKPLAPMPLSAPLQKHQLTTLMLRNIPNDYTQAMFTELLDSNGLAAKYDFVYLPIDFTRMAGLGYGFVNFVSQADAEFAKLRLQGFSQWKVQSQKVCSVCWGEPLQGLQAHIERYRSSPVMHRDVPEHFKPTIFSNGVKVPFPSPTRRVRAPKR